MARLSPRQCTCKRIEEYSAFIEEYEAGTTRQEITPETYCNKN